MTTQEIVGALACYPHIFPRAALSEAPRHKEELIPHLLGALDHVCDNADTIMAEDSYNDLHFHAMYLLAQFREKQAFPKLIRLFRKDQKTLDYFLGDTLTEDGNRCLYSVYDGNLGLLKELIEDTNANEYARGAAVEAYGFITRGDRAAREEMTGYFRRLIHERLTGDTSMLPTLVSSCIIDEHLFELIPDVKFLYDKDCIDSFFHGGYDGFIDCLFMYSWDRKPVFIDNVVEELARWVKYSKKPKPKEPVQKPQEKPKKKTGRNDPCPCGSGKKYKKCCLPLGVRFDDEEDDEQPEKSTNEIFDDFLRSSYDKPYDLMQNYPRREPFAEEGRRTITEFYSPKAIEMDIPVYKALCHRTIPVWVKRNSFQEDLERIDFLLEAFAMFTQTCEEEHLETFADFDKKYMVHYESAHWVGSLGELLERYADKISAEKRAAREAVNAALERMKTLA